MTIYNGSVIIWTNKQGKVFNDIKDADKYFDEQMELGNHPCWERIWKKPISQYGIQKHSGETEL